ncbi:MAG: amidophosphoribosyltransferase [Chloroflexota bacterium]|nr:MAG: amidophosphoribosyltransferase [Chloroflexota bacterium]
MHEACGIFGIYAPGVDVARTTFFGLFALQHRGQESAGIAVAGDGVRVHKGMGLVSQVFTEDSLAGLRGISAIGHNRYSTTGSSRYANAQPILTESHLGRFALAHNGNIFNAGYLRNRLSGNGCEFSSTSDSEVIALLIAASYGHDWVSKIQHTMPQLAGAYSLVLLTDRELIGVRDPLGVRPLCIGRHEAGWVLASESCALDTIGAHLVREVEPGEIVIIDENGLHSVLGQQSERKALCIFEYIYFARPDSQINGRLLYETREAMGAALAREYPVPADIVMDIPDSATAAGIGYARQSGVPFSTGLIKNRYIGRTFIQPDQRIRKMGVELKFNPLPGVLSGKRVVVVDDSIVRGTTTLPVINLLRKAGVKEVHLRICAPPITHPCYFGVDMATRAELIAARHSVEEIARHVGADSLGYLSLEGLIQSVSLPQEVFCLACFTGQYPIPVQLEMDKLAFEHV